MAKSKSISKIKKIKVHSWRLCPGGAHWVSEHSRKTSKGAARVKGHCRLNSSRKDQIYSGELIHISEKYFSKLLELPRADNLDFKYRGNKYDILIAGWTTYWNDVLAPDERLDPNLVKALIATESGFHLDAKVRAGKRAFAGFTGKGKQPLQN